MKSRYEEKLFLFFVLFLALFEENERRMRLCKSDIKKKERTEKKTAELKSKAYLIVRL